MEAAELDLADAARSIARNQSACLQVFRDIEQSLERSRSLIGLCNEGPTRDALLKQQRLLEAAVEDAALRICQAFALKMPGLSKLKPQRLSLVGGTDIVGATRAARG